ncbi:MAG: TolC family outer membrane protein [Rhodospirillales bacterium]|nr:TolC family outer membrane protein [Rhodospirillales bacterium]
MTLRDAVAVGVATNPEYGIVASSRRATDEELRQAQGLYLPSIDFRGDTGYEYSDDPGTRARGAATGGDDTENMWRYEAGITLTQMLFDGWDSQFENIRQKARVQSSAHRVREAAELVGLSVVESYLEVLRQRELLGISQQNITDHLNILAQIQDGVKAGRSTQADLEQARARLASSRSQESSIREALRAAESSYIKTVGDPPANLYPPVAPKKALAPNLEEEVKAAVTRSPTLDIYESDIRVAHAEFEGTQSTLYPQVDLQLNARTGHDLGGVEGRDTSASGLVVANWNLYRGGADVARAREFIHREQQAKENRDKAARALEDDVRRTWARMVSSRERAREFSDQTNANIEVVKAYRDQFNLDRRTLLDVLDAQNELFVSQSNLVNSRYLEMLAAYRIVALKGDLFPTLGIDYPRESDPKKM